MSGFWCAPENIYSESISIGQTPRQHLGNGQQTNKQIKETVSQTDHIVHVDERSSGACWRAAQIWAFFFIPVVSSLQTNDSRVWMETSETTLSRRSRLSTCFVPHQRAAVVFTHVRAKGETPPIDAGVKAPFVFLFYISALPGLPCLLPALLIKAFFPLGYVGLACWLTCPAPRAGSPILTLLGSS